MKIISGGQTGVDRAALDAAVASGIPVGGWCPKGRLAEDGAISRHLPGISLAGNRFAALSGAYRVKRDEQRRYADSVGKDFVRRNRFDKKFCGPLCKAAAGDQSGGFRRCRQNQEMADGK